MLSITVSKYVTKTNFFQKLFELSCWKTNKYVLQSNNIHDATWSENIFYSSHKYFNTNFRTRDVRKAAMQSILVEK
jgi:hypothetical protein